MTPRLVPLSEVCQMDRTTLPPARPEAGHLPYVGVENVTSGTGMLDLDSTTRVGDGKSTTFRFDERHVLYAKLRPYLNKVATPDFAGKCSTELVPLLPRDGVDRQYLAHLLRRQSTVDRVMASVTGARMPRTDMSVLMSMPVPLPPLEEQRRIVDILNRAASLQRLRAQASARLRALIPALFIRIFGDPLDNPIGWQVRPLGEVVTGFQGGKNVQAGSGASPFRILKVSAVTSGSFDPDESKPAPDNYLPPEDHFVREGDLLFSRANTAALVGATTIVERPVAGVLLPDKLWRVVWREPSPVLPIFLLHFLQMPSTRSAMSALATGTSASMKNISQAKMKRLPVLVPPSEIQAKYAEMVSFARGITVTAETAARATSALNAALMARLLAEPV